MDSHINQPCYFNDGSSNTSNSKIQDVCLAKSASDLSNNVASYSIIGFPSTGQVVSVIDKFSPIQFNYFDGNEKYRGDLKSFKATNNGIVIIDVGYAFKRRALENNNGKPFSEYLRSELQITNSNVNKVKNSSYGEKQLNPPEETPARIIKLKTHNMLPAVAAAQDPANNVFKPKHVNLTIDVKKGDVISFGFSTANNPGNLMFYLDKNNTYMSIREINFQ